MRWTVGLKIAGMSAIALIVLITIGIAMDVSTKRIAAATDWRSHTYEVIGGINDLRSYLVDAETGQRGYLVTGQDQFLDPYRTAVVAIPEQIKTLRSLTSDNPVQQHNLDLLEPLIASKMANIQNSLQPNIDPATRTSMMVDGKKTMDDIRGILSDMTSEEQGLLVTRDKVASDSINSTFMLIEYGTVISVLLLGLFGFLLTRNISDPLKKMTNVAANIAAGDLSTKIEVVEKRQDEVGELSKSFLHMSESLQKIADVSKQISMGDLTVNIKPQSEKDTLGNSLAQMVENLRKLTADNQDGVNLLNSSVGQIFNSTTELASAGSESVAAINETTTTMEEARQLSHIANDKAKKVAESVQNSEQISQLGKKSVEEINVNMQLIHKQMDSIAQSMVNLSEQNQAISGLIATVDDLAQQSNLLAVNAAIEAAKAGEQGKGFFVVAQEIKSLADQSKQATNQVRELLNNIQKATSASVMATEQAGKAVEIGVQKSGEASESIHHLSNSVSEASQAATQISVSTHQQLVGIEQIVGALGNIKQAVTTNLDSAKQLEEAARALKELGHKIQGMVHQYKI